MDAFLREVKIIVNSLNAINFRVSDQDLIEYVTLAIGSDYDNLVTSLTNIGPISVNDFKLHLLHYDQRQRALQAHDNHLTQHPAFVVTSQEGTTAATGSANNNNATRSGKGGGYKGKDKKGKSGGPKRNNSSTSSNSRDAATGTASSMTDESLNNMNLPPTCASSFVCAGSQHPEGLASPHPSVVCQICNSPGNSAK
ncbi:hypothetical protein RND81_08G114500 [Saponaria officinalis]|uniref:Uncharacterized protein n=1 Tax=Saponaria officinalis TaxID=3572 RepID=A0AAW1J6V2_SAPOF